MGNVFYVFYGQARAADAGNLSGPQTTHDAMRAEDLGRHTADGQRGSEWRDMSCSLSLAPLSPLASSHGFESLEDLHHRCLQQYGGAIMPVYDEGMQCGFVDESEPIFDDDMDEDGKGEEREANEKEDNEQGDDGDRLDTPVTAAEAARDGTERTGGIEGTEQQRRPLQLTALEDDWLLTMPSDSPGGGSHVLRISLDGTSRSTTAMLQHDGVITSAKSEGPSSSSSELNSLMSKVALLQSKVTEVEELRDYWRRWYCGNHVATIPCCSPLVSFFDNYHYYGSGTITSIAFAKKHQLTSADVEKQVYELIGCSDLSAANAPKAVENYVKCFANHKQALEDLVQRYPFLIKKLPLKPKSAFQRMQVWERELFSTLDEKQAITWRKAKEFEIQKWETKEEILAEIDRIRVQIKEKERKEREKELQKDQQNVMASMMQEMQSKFRSTQLEQEKLQAQAELQDLEDEPLDLDDDV